MASIATRSRGTASSKDRLKNNAAPIRNEVHLRLGARAEPQGHLPACSIARSVCPAHSLRKPLMCQPRA